MKVLFRGTSFLFSIVFTLSIPILIFMIEHKAFQLKSDYAPAGDQPKAIQDIVDAFANGEKAVTLMGATATGKTFTMANVIQQVQKPTLIISHNKTLAAQLATEFKHFFPNNAVHYFVSYFDYYQPEAYVASKDLYVEKEATINEEIEMYRLATLASLLSRDDVIIVASASSLYGLGQKEFFADHSLQLKVGEEYNFKELKKKLIQMRYEPVASKIEPGTFDFQGERLDIYSSTDRHIYRCFFDEEKLEFIQLKDSLSFEDLSADTQVDGKIDKATIWPATQYLQNVEDLNTILDNMLLEMNTRADDLDKSGHIVEAQRLRKRVEYDVRMIRETGFVNGIENYSPYFDGRLPGQVPYTIFDYLPDDFLLIIDESHMTLPQLMAMPKADTARKASLVTHGFRLPSAVDHRPIRFEELEVMMDRADTIQSTLSKKIKLKTDADSDEEVPLTEIEQKVYDYQTYRNNLFNISTDVAKNHMMSLESKKKIHSKALFVSATPAPYELELTNTVVEQIIRPTGLLDPLVSVYPKSGDNDYLLKSIDTLIAKKPHLTKFLDRYQESEAGEALREDD